MWRVLLVLFEVVFIVMPVSWTLTQVFAIKVIRPADYRNLMRLTARQEMEIYGFVVSSSVEWWLKDNDVEICRAHPGLLHGRSGVLMGGIVYCECPPNHTEVIRHYREARTPPKGRGAASVKGGYIATGPVPPPNPGMSVAERCLKKCRTSELEEIWGDGQVIARWCAKHGTRRDPVPPPPPPIGGLILPTRPNPTKGVRR